MHAVALVALAVVIALQSSTNSDRSGNCDNAIHTQQQQLQDAVDRQRIELEALHASQNRAEKRTSAIHSMLKESEKELAVLEREMQEVSDHMKCFCLQQSPFDTSAIYCSAATISDAVIAVYRSPALYIAAAQPRTPVLLYNTAREAVSAECISTAHSRCKVLTATLQQLTHERDLLQRGLQAPTAANDKPLQSASASGSAKVSSQLHALEARIQLKRAERAERKRALETDFAAVFKEVGERRAELEKLGSALKDLEATRDRKQYKYQLHGVASSKNSMFLLESQHQHCVMHAETRTLTTITATTTLLLLQQGREFTRIQTNLMSLLEEQKNELDALRDTGVQLESAAATTAAAAAATAQRAAQHEAAAATAFGQTEELLMFQMMSMSLSYFSSLNMFKQSDTVDTAVYTFCCCDTAQMREIEADTTTAAITSSADAAAAAAAAASAARVPGVHSLGSSTAASASESAYITQGGYKLGMNGTELKQKREESEAEAAAAELTRAARQRTLPPAVADWSLTDVSYWLHSLSLGEYSAAFKAACVDGAFLLTLTQDDCAGALGMRHTLHIKKLFTALATASAAPATTNSAASSSAAVVVAAAARTSTADNSNDSSSNDSNSSSSSSSDAVEAALSQARHGRVARLDASLRQGVVSANARCRRTGNTLLIEAAQNCCTDCCQLLVQRGADVNARNKRGNTALHYAMAHDPSGLLGEFLIENGANDTLLNSDGLSPYDGVVGGTV
eukprot:2237-Heterococcus_DN1.PRE.3